MTVAVLVAISLPFAAFSAGDTSDQPGEEPPSAPPPVEGPADTPPLADEPAEAPGTDEEPAEDPATGEEPAEAPATGDASGPWFTEQQAARGAAQYRVHCASCHGAELEGVFAPGLSGGEFFDVWTTAGHLYDFYSTAMPPTNPGGLSDRAYTDILAHILHFNGYPAGEEELPVDSELFYQIPVERMDQ